MNSQLRLEQQAFLKGRQSFELRDEETLRVVVKKALTTREFNVPLKAIDPDFSKFRKMPAGWIVTMVILGLFSTYWWSLLVPVIKDWAAEPSSAVAAMITAVIFTLLFAVSFYGFRVNRVNSVIFHSRFNSQPVLVLWEDLPAKESFDSFIASLVAEIKREGEKLGDGGSGIAEEIRKLKKLMDEGAITKEDFEAGKEKILKSLDGKRPMGFGGH